MAPIGQDAAFKATSGQAAEALSFSACSGWRRHPAPVLNGSQESLTHFAVSGKVGEREGPSGAGNTPGRGAT